MLALCAPAWAATDLSALRDANQIGAVCDVYPSTVQRLVYYDLDTGAVSISAEVYTINDPERGAQHIYLYSDGGAFVWADGGGYGRHGENGQFYVVGCVGDFYEEKMRQIKAQNMGEFFDGQTIAAEERLADGNLRITTVGPVPEDNPNYGEALLGRTLIAHYEINPDTLIMQSVEVRIRDGDGTEKLFLRSTLQTNPALVMPFDVTPLTQPEATREVRVIVNPGAENETEQVLTAPLNIVMYLYVPDGYALYDNAACTMPMSRVQPDENGCYPDSMTVYCKKQ